MFDLLVLRFCLPSLRNSGDIRYYRRYQNPCSDHFRYTINRTYESNNKYLAIRTGFPLFRHSSCASSCWSLSIRSANLLISLDRWIPVTFFPHVVLNALRAALTARSISFAEAIAIDEFVLSRRDTYNTSNDRADDLFCSRIYSPVYIKMNDGIWF
jgi:hypothetical protein